MKELTQEYVKELFTYKNGFLYWKNINKHCHNRKNGDKAGSLNKSGYYQIGINNKRYFTHRIIYLYHYRYLPKKIDHIDNNPSNNNIENLRKVTQSQNCMNRKPHKNRSSKYKGVCWHKASNKWIAQICINYKIIYLGLFINKIDAAIAYNKKAKELFGEFANLNEV